MKPWPKVRLGEVLRRVERFEPRDELTEYPFAGTYSFARGIFVGERKLGSSFALPKIQRIRAGDFIYCKIMAWEGAFGIAPKETDNCVMSGAFVVYELNRAKIDEKFLDYFFKVPHHWQSIGSQSSGTNVRRQSLHPTQFEKAEIPLPPLAEQRRVVARIEELAAQIHEARTLRHQAAEEAEAILRSRLNKFIEAAGTDKMPTRTVGSFTRFDRYGPRFYDQSYSETGTPIVRATDIDDHGRIDFSTMPKLEVAPDEVKKLKAEVGDLLVVRSGSIGLSAVFKNPDIKCIPAAYLIQFRFDDSADPHFVRYCLQAPSIQQELVGRGTTVQNLNAKKIKSTPIPFPPLAEQRRIVGELDALQAEVDALKRLQAETAAELAALLPALLDRAFKGEM